MTVGIFLLQMFYTFNKINHFRKIDDELAVRYFVRVVYENTTKTHVNRGFLLST